MRTINTDLVILGGGIAGLWLLNRMQQQGFDALLLETNTLGGGQSIRSQGIIHGGTKYALNGALTQAANAIADMPARWKACLEGHGEIDLTSAEILSDAHYMWSKATLGSKMTSFFASKALKGRVDQISPEQRPAVFKDDAFRGNLYKLNEIVLNVPSVVQALAKPYIHRIIKADPTLLEILANHQEITQINLTPDVTINAQRYITTAGEGTEALLETLQLKQPQMQRRPLHMVMVRHQSDLPTFAHCISGGSKPEITITSHPTNNGEQVWYLGGNLAETGLELSHEEQIIRGQGILKKLLPWIELKTPRWAAFHINRAEPKQSALTRPDAAYAEPAGNNIISWPTKLALAPDLADRIHSQLQAQGITPQHSADSSYLERLPRPEIAQPVWETLFC